MPSFEGSSRAGRAFLRWRLLAPLSALLYRASVRVLSRWPLSFSPTPVASPPAGERRIAYYHHAFPLLSETFIQREVAALREAGVDVVVLAHAPGAAESFDELARRMAATTIYIPRMRAHGLPRCFWPLARRHPLRLAGLFLYAVGRRHAARKRYGRDRALFNQAVVLAGELCRRGITHVHSPWASLDATAALMAARLAGIGYSVQARASDIHLRSARHGRTERLRHAAFIITNTRYNESILRGLLPEAAPSIHVVSNGIDLRRFCAQAPRRLPSAVARILFVGRLVEPKGIEYLLRACRILLDRGRRLQCELIGPRVPDEMNYHLELRKTARALWLDDHVAFRGARSFDGVLAAYCEADVFVLPAVVAGDGRREITPNVLLEAMAMRVPVVTTPVGAIAEIVEDAALLVPARDENALADAIERVLDDAALRQRLGCNGRRRVERHFDVQRNIAAYVALFAASQAGGRSP